MKICLDPSKKYYKVNLHCHSRLSDGRATPETIKEEYKKRGYSAVAFTDHEHLINSKALSDEEFIAITGCELGISGDKVDTYAPLPSSKQLHINLFAKDPDCVITPFYAEKHDWYKFDDVRHMVVAAEPFERAHTAERINEMVKRAHELGFLVSYNHPDWSLETAEDYLGYEGFDFIEVHNTGCVKSGHFNDEYAFDNMMKAGKRIFCVATDDNHNAYGFDEPNTDSFGGWVMVAADRLGYSELMTSLENGDFYASTGPEIHSISVSDEGTVDVRCSEAKRIFLITQGRRNSRVLAEEGGFVTEASFKLYPQDVRFRIRVDDGKGCSAFSQIYDVPEDAPRVVIKKG